MRQSLGGRILMRYSFTKPFCLKTSTSSCSTSSGLPLAISLSSPQLDRMSSLAENISADSEIFVKEAAGNYARSDVGFGTN